jgi:hypothetical protein
MGSPGFNPWFFYSLVWWSQTLPLSLSLLDHIIIQIFKKGDNYELLLESSPRSIVVKETRSKIKSVYTKLSFVWTFNNNVCLDIQQQCLKVSHRLCCYLWGGSQGYWSHGGWENFYVFPFIAWNWNCMSNFLRKQMNSIRNKWLLSHPAVLRIHEGGRWDLRMVNSLKFVCTRNTRQLIKLGLLCITALESTNHGTQGI